MPENTNKIIQQPELGEYQAEISEAVNTMNIQKLITAYKKREKIYLDAVVYALAIIAAGKIAARAYSNDDLLFGDSALDCAAEFYSDSDKLKKPTNVDDFLENKFNLLPELTYIASLSFNGMHEAALIRYARIQRYADAEIHALIILAGGLNGNLALAFEADRVAARLNLANEQTKWAKLQVNNRYFLLKKLRKDAETAESKNSRDDRNAHERLQTMS